MEVEIPARTLVKPHTDTREDEFSLVLRAPPRAGVLPARRALRLTIQDDWIEALERAHGVKL